MAGMGQSDILIRGAREHNLRDVSLDLPRGKLICFTGVSGSGKSSLAFDTLYAEGQRRYVESLSSYARQFLGQMPKPDVDKIEGLSPSISIQQKTGGRNPRSTVGTITEINDYLRVLFARVGQGFCPQCDRPIAAQTREQIVARVMELPEGTALTILAPVIRGQKGEYKDLFAELARAGFVRARVDGKIANLTDNLALDRQIKHDIEVVIDRLKAGQSSRSRLAEAVESALKRGDGAVIVVVEGQPDLLLSSQYACPACGIGFDPPSPQLFSFNSPQGMCPSCDGLGIRHDFSAELLVPNPKLSLWKGAVAPFGAVSEMGRWRRHIFEGVAANLAVDPGAPSAEQLLKGPWEKLRAEYQRAWLYGTGDRVIVHRWRTRGKVFSHAEKWAGIATDLLEKYKSSAGGPYRMMLEPYMRSMVCPDCKGMRLNARARSVRVGGKTLVELGAMPIGVIARFFDLLADPGIRDGGRREENGEVRGAKRTAKGDRKTKTSFRGAKGDDGGNAGDLRSDNATVPTPLDALSRIIAEELLKEIRGRLGFLTNVGLHYLTLDRAAPTLSGGEAQRIRLASQVGAGLVGVLYILDEPSIGLHPRDNEKLLGTLCRLRDVGNTVIVVEHDEDTMRAADHLVDFGPGPGIKGGDVVISGDCDALTSHSESLTGQYLSGRKCIEIPQERIKKDKRKVRIVGARQNNLKNINVDIPLGLFVCVTGVSGSGKSSLIGDILREALANLLNGAQTEPGAHDRIEGVELLDKIIDIDQSPIGRTPRSNPGTYIKLFDQIRDLYTKLPDAKARGYKAGRFSFNVSGGRCEACEGNGSNRLEMDFLADVWVTCPVCEGKRFNRETLHVRFKGKSISDVLEMDVQEALEHFTNVPKIAAMLQTLHDVGLDYMKIGQASPSLSGGEAQRIKLARELVKKGTGRTLYVLDEPTTGLHFDDINKLLKVLRGFTALGNTVVVIEHNLDVIKTADWIIDLGPEGGEGGGRVIAQGTPEDVAKVPESFTGQALQRALAPPAKRARKHAVKATAEAANGNGKRKGKSRSSEADLPPIEVRGARQHNLKGIDVDIPRHQMTVCSGPSGSGKSSLAIDTLYAEGQRRYVESLSSYARQFLAPLQKPKVESISGLAPAVSIEQKTTSKSPRSTVGTVTEIQDYLRILFARLGQPYCPKCDLPIGTQSADEIVEKILHLPEGSRVYVMAPVERRDGEEYDHLWNDLRASGFTRVRVDGKSTSLDDPPKLSHRRKHRVEVVIDRAVIRRSTRSRLADSVEAALDLGKGVALIALVDDAKDESKWQVDRYSQHRSCDKCGRGFEELSPNQFSFNSPLGWCPTCEGLGVQQGADPSAIIADSRLSLRQGAVSVWPQLGSGTLFTDMIHALTTLLGIDWDRPFEELEARQRRMILHGTGDTWFTVPATTGRAEFSFQYKGLFPALEEAGRVSFWYRSKLQGMVREVECVACMGSRLRDDAAAVRFRGFTLDQVSRWPLSRTLEFVKSLKLTSDERHIAGDLIREIRDRLTFLVDVGLNYLSLSRGTPTLSGGESQRIRLASQLGSGLTGVLYVLDEPTIGLHPRDNLRLLSALKRLRDLGNTLVLVEHDREVIESADNLVDFGPGSGDGGGQITALGTPSRVRNSPASLTGRYLRGQAAVPVPTNRRDASGPTIVVRGARQNNLRDITVAFPLGVVTVVTGVSGSGKSTLVEDILMKAAAKKLHRAAVTPGAHSRIDGLERVDKVISVDQTPIGGTPASNPATYSGLFDLIRELFAKMPEAKLRGYSPGRFSFNLAGGRCEACEGAGQRRIEMHFLPDVWVACEACGGARYTAETLAVKYRGKSIADVLEMKIDAALELFASMPKIRRILQTLADVGLGYVSLGQAGPTLSGGEAQRVKLAAELAKPDTGKTLYILDEPTTGLHMDDVKKLLAVVHRLADLGNTVVIIEHNLDVIKTADWVIDLGPEAGEAGGLVVCEGPPECVASTKESLTGQILKGALEAGPHEERIRFDPEAAARVLIEQAREAARAQVAVEVRQPWEVDGRRWHTQDRVGRNGKPARWDGQILGSLVDRLEALKLVTDWSQRTVARVVSPQAKAPAFLEAMTGHEWVLTLRFRVARRTFQMKALSEELGLKPFHEITPPVLCDHVRLEVTNDQRGWQDITLVVHAASELETRPFNAFLDCAFVGYRQLLSILGFEDFTPAEKPPWREVKLPRKAKG
jgi:excinuclease ABC subunit A